MPYNFIVSIRTVRAGVGSLVLALAASGVSAQPIPPTFYTHTESLPFLFFDTGIWSPGRVDTLNLPFSQFNPSLGTLTRSTNQLSVQLFGVVTTTPTALSTLSASVIVRSAASPGLVLFNQQFNASSNALVSPNPSGFISRELSSFGNANSTGGFGNLDVGRGGVPTQVSLALRASPSPAVISSPSVEGTLTRSFTYLVQPPLVDRLLAINVDPDNGQSLKSRLRLGLQQGNERDIATTLEGIAAYYGRTAQIFDRLHAIAELIDNTSNNGAVNLYARGSGLLFSDAATLSRRLGADPPRADFRTLAAFDDSFVSSDFSAQFGSEYSAVDSFVTALHRANGGMTPLIDSFERLQGAVLAQDQQGIYEQSRIAESIFADTQASFDAAVAASAMADPLLRGLTTDASFAGYLDAIARDLPTASLVATAIASTTVSAVPEPSTYLLFMAGLVAVATRRQPKVATRRRF